MNRSRVIDRLRCVGLVILVLARLGAASAEPKRVLLLHSFGREVGPFDAFANGFSLDLEQQSKDPLKFYEVSLEPADPGEPSEQSVVRFLVSMFARRPPDLIVPVGGPASTFAHNYRSQLFPATPMLMTAVDERHFEQAHLTATEAVVAVRHDLPMTIENKVELTVRDEGTGFHAKKAMLSGGLGLPSMEQRLKSVNGQVSIDSEPGRGTVIQVRVPLQFKQKAAHSG